MANPAAAPAGAPAVSFRWIIDKRNDLVWYIGSALVGWLYVGLVLLAVSRLQDPMNDALGVLKLGGLHIPITLQLLVYSSWAFLLDAPHLWSTLARTFFDAEERRVRRRELWLSWGWFLVGPAAIFAPYLINWLLKPTGLALPAGALGLGALAFTVLFRLWAYYHVVRQHWGFVALYRRKNGDMAPAAGRVDTWFFNLAFYAPLAMFLTSPLYERTPGFPSLGLQNLAVTPVLHVLIWALFLGAILFYIGYQIHLRRQGQPLNGPKLILLGTLIPLHLVAFSNPWLAALVTPIVTVGHNLQYHRIVWMYGQNKYATPEGRSKYRPAAAIFGRFWIYFGVGLLFTFALYRGPWIDWARSAVGMSLDQSFLNGVGMMAGLADPTKLNLGQQLFGALLLGWAMQHYYLDSKIWRVGRDRSVAKQLQVD
jgi:uncharacterized membrane protein (DUF485 family)